jgi:ankyrin repeat protein
VERRRYITLCRHNDTSVVLDLIRGGAGIETQDAVMMTPIHHAAIHGDFDTVQVLLEAGADASVVDGTGGFVHTTGSERSVYFLRRRSV